MCRKSSSHVVRAWGGWSISGGRARPRPRSGQRLAPRFIQRRVRPRPARRARGEAAVSKALSARFDESRGPSGIERTALIIERYLGREVLRTVCRGARVLVLVYGADRFSRGFSPMRRPESVSPGLIVQILSLKLAEKLPVFSAAGALPRGAHQSRPTCIGTARWSRSGRAGSVCGRLSRGIFRVVAVFSLAERPSQLFVSPSAASVRLAPLRRRDTRPRTGCSVPGRSRSSRAETRSSTSSAVDSETGRMSNVFVRVRKPHRQVRAGVGAAYHRGARTAGARYIGARDGWRNAGLPGDACVSP